jgi:hypothetical protein
MNAIQVWRFEDAPEELRKLSTNGGDEDWLAVIPAALKMHYWVDAAMSEDIAGPARNAFGCSSIDIIEREDGSQVRIGSHS